MEKIIYLNNLTPEQLAKVSKTGRDNLVRILKEVAQHEQMFEYQGDAQYVWNDFGGY